MLLTSLAVDQLLHALPTAGFTYLVGPWAADVVRHGPGPVTVARIDFPAFTRRPKGSLVAPYALLGRTAAHLRKTRYDAAVIFRPDDWWGALLALAAGIPVRLGMRLPQTEPLLTHALSPMPAEHATAQTRRLADYAIATLGGTPLASPTGRPIFRLTLQEQTVAGQLLESLGLAERRPIALQPSAGAPLKSWPVERWARVADELVRDGAAVLLVGGPDDRHLLGAVQAAMGQPAAPLLTGQPLAVTAAIFARCALLVGLDGGAAHLAAALGTPTVRLYGPADPITFGPWPAHPTQRVLLAAGLACAPCGALEQPPCGATSLPACMLALEPRHVVVAARQALADNES